MDHNPDEDLAREAGQGNPVAFEALMKRHSGPLLLFCRHVLQDSVAAEDAVQETFLRIYLHLQRYDPSRRLSSWIYAIAHNVCRDALRVRGREVPARSLEPASTEPAEGDPRSDQIEGRLVQLPAKHRAILFHKYRLGLNTAEIAEQLGFTAADVRTSLHRLLKVLKRSFVP
jgi:RNA polymerase sigma-70 factor (ECF subfamily)